MKKIASGIRGVVRGVKKVFKEVTDSKIGKALLVAATVYVGGGMLGAWNTPFESINGVLNAGSKLGGGGGGTAATAAEATTTGANMLAPTGKTIATTAGGSPGTINLGSLGAGSAAPAAGAGAGAGAAGSAALTAPTGFTAGTGATATGAGGTVNVGSLGTGAGAAGGAGAGTAATTAAGAGAGAEAAKGLLGRAMGTVGKAAKEVGGFIQDNPIPSYLGFNAISSALSPDEIELMQAQDRILAEREQSERDRRERNLAVAGINLGVRPNGTPLVDMSGNPVFSSTGMLNRARYS